MLVTASEFTVLVIVAVAADVADVSVAVNDPVAVVPLVGKIVPAVVATVMFAGKPLAPATMLLSFASFSCTVIVDVLDPFAVIVEALGRIVDRLGEMACATVTVTLPVIPEVFSFA